MSSTPLRLGLGALMIGLTLSAAETEDVSKEKAIELPSMVVADAPDLPKPESWRYTRIPDFEVLSNASDADSQRIVADLQRFRQVIALVSPDLPLTSSVPTSLILCGAHGSYALFDPTTQGFADSVSASTFARDSEAAAIVVNVEQRILNVSLDSSDQQTNEDNGMEGGAEMDFSHELRRNYVHFLMSRSTPRPAPWLEEGMAQLLASIQFSKDRIQFGLLPQSSTQTTNKDAFNKTFQNERLIPLKDLLNASRDSEEARTATTSEWASECWLFVHLCLYGENGKFKGDLTRFVALTQDKPVTEELFKQAFHMSFSDFELEMRVYVEETAYKYQELKNAKLGDEPKITLRDATDAEVGRIKGDALRLAGKKDDARLTLLAPYVRGSRDPDLLAALGIQERSLGHTDKASAFLQIAIATGTTRARAFSTLGQINFERAAAKPAGAHGTFSTGQVITILRPLFAGLRVPPPQPESYELIAKTWEKSEVKPSADNVGIVTQGANRFPKDLELIYLDADLLAKTGDQVSAAKLARYGVRAAQDEALKARFAALGASLPPTP